MPYLTERELVDRYNYYILEVENQLLQGEDFNNLTNDIPFQIHLNASADLSLMATNHAFTEQLGYPIEQIWESGAEVFEYCVHPDSLALYPELLERSKRNESASFTFTHQLRVRGEITEYSPVVTFTKQTKLPDAPMLCLSPLLHNFGSMVDKVKKIIEIDEFKMKNFSRFQQLSPREIEILRFLGQGYTNPQISELLYISRQTVETHRKNLKAKLGIKSFHALIKYALAFGLIKI